MNIQDGDINGENVQHFQISKTDLFSMDFNENNAKILRKKLLKIVYMYIKSAFPVIL